MISSQELEWSAPTGALPAAQEEEEPRPERGRPRGHGHRRARGSGMSASQPVPERPSMLDDGGDIDFDTVLHSWRKGQHTTYFSD